MDDGIGAIVLILTVLALSFFFFIYLIEELYLVFIIITLIMIPILGYACLLTISTKWDKHRAIKD